MDAIEQLDAVLFAFNPNSITNERSFTMQGIIERLTQKELKISDERLLEMLHKLIKDNHIRFEQVTMPNVSVAPGTVIDFYVLTFEGELLQIKGGYQALDLQASLKANRVELLEKATMANNKWMKVGSLGAAIIGGCYLIWDVVKYFLEHCFLHKVR